MARSGSEEIIMEPELMFFFTDLDPVTIIFLVGSKLISQVQAWHTYPE
jgi:hypothetical protein